MRTGVNWARQWRFYALLAVTLLLASALRAMPPGMHALDVRLFHTGPEAAAFLHSLGAVGRAKYTLHQLVDFIYMAAFSTLFWQLVRRLGGAPWLLVLALLPGAFDFAEDSMHLLLIRQFPDMSGDLLSLIGYVTAAKWVLVALFVAAMIATAWQRRIIRA